MPVTPSSLDAFSAPCRSWFVEAFGTPTAVQEAGWDKVAGGAHALMLAPTGSGKTLAAFFWAIDRLVRLPVDAGPGVRVLYISPLKALVTDIERNLRAPLVGVMRHAERLEVATRQVRVGMRTGDTPAKERAQMLRQPPDILVTTPESLYLMLGSRASAMMAHVHTIIVDEIHAVAGSKRGAHLALSLERLEEVCTTRPQRIGLSATVKPHEEAAKFLAGAREVAIIDFSARPALSLRVEVPVEDMTKLPALPKAAPTDADSGSLLGQIARTEKSKIDGAPPGAREVQGLWAFIYPRIFELLQAHRTTLIFVNSRSTCERMAEHLNRLAGEEMVRAHHGSVSLKKRSEIEEALKGGELRGIVATSSLELGIDMGSIELVVLVESPGSVARGLQRIGRAGHGVGQISHGVVFPKNPIDLLECAVVAGRMRAGTIEPLCVPQNPLDVLAQQLVALCSDKAWHVDALLSLVRRSYPFHKLTQQALHATLDMLSGHYPSDEFAELRPLLSWDRAKNEVSGRRSARLTCQLNAGTIPDRGAFGVFLAGEGPRVGELDEEMVHESRRGDVFMLGASSWRIEQITRDKVLVTPAPGEPGKLPFWRGEGPGRPIELGRALGALIRQLDGATENAFAKITGDELGLEPQAQKNLRRLLQGQREATQAVPNDEQIVVERFRDELGDWRVCILTPLGARVHAPWALALQSLLSERLGYVVQAIHSDDGIALRLPNSAGMFDLDLLLPSADEVQDRVMNELGRSALFAGAFRENAARALLLPRRAAQGRAPLWQQRLRSKTLLAAAERYPSFPIVLETYRQCLRDVFDVPALTALLDAIGRREVRVVHVETPTASPFARSLAYAYVANYLYEADAPLAERRAQALVLDRTMLSTLLGEVEMRSLLDQGAIDEVELQLQRRVGTARARDADGVHDLLRTLGDLTEEEIVVRCRRDDKAVRAATDKGVSMEGPDAAGIDAAAVDVAQVTAWLEDLLGQKRIFRSTFSGHARYIAVEDAARYRDALGVVLPSDLSARFVASAEQTPLEGLIARYARNHGPFLPEPLMHRYGLGAPSVRAALERLTLAGVLVHGDLLPHGQTPEWCDAEVLRRLKRVTLARLRNEVAAVPARAFARFLPAWHNIDKPRRGNEALLASLAQLAGIALSFSAWCNEVLPARVQNFVPDMLDMQCAMGAVVWVGCGSLGARDGRVAFYTRAQARALIEPPADYVAATPMHEAVLEHGKLAALQQVLWDLVWAGQITNDTVQPLRSLKSRSVGLQAVGGRWSSVRNLCAPTDSASHTATARSHARAGMLLERYGVACREAAAFEDIPGGFTPLYQVLKAMEEAGQVRRGLFVEGLGGAQFAYGAAIERLRAGMRAGEERDDPAQVLCAVDPANPFGSLLPWPERFDPADPGKLRRMPGARVIACGGELLGYLDATGQALTLFAACRSRADGFHALIEGLGQLRRDVRGRSLRLQRIDQQPALQHPAIAQLLAAGMVATWDGVMLREGEG